MYAFSQMNWEFFFAHYCAWNTRFVFRAQPRVEESGSVRNPFIFRVPHPLKIIDPIFRNLIGENKTKKILNYRIQLILFCLLLYFTDFWIRVQKSRIRIGVKLHKPGILTPPIT